MSAHSGRYGKKPVKLRSFMFASFFGAFMIAAAYGYFHYKFSQFKFLNFRELRLYSDKDLFMPDKEEYILLVYSSKKNSVEKLKKRLKSKEVTVLAVDFAQHVRMTKDNLIVVTGGYDHLLKIANKFRIEHLPSAFYIKRQKETLYKQDSRVTEF